MADVQRLEMGVEVDIQERRDLVVGQVEVEDVGG